MAYTYGLLDIAFNETGAPSWLGDASVSVRLVVDVLSQNVASKSAQIKFRFEAYKLNNAFYNTKYGGPGGLTGECTYIAVNGEEAEKDSYYGTNYIGGGEKYGGTTGGEYLGLGTGKWYTELISTMTLWTSNTYTIYYDKNDTANVSFNATLDFYLGGDPHETTWHAEARGVQYSVNFDLPALPRYAEIADSPNFNDEQNPTIIYVVPIGTTNIEVGILDSNGNILIDYVKPNSGDVTGAHTFRFTQAERQKFWKILEQGLSSTKVYFAIKSYYAPTNTSYLKLTPARTLTIVNYMPTVEPVVWDFNPITVALTTGGNASTTEGGPNTSYKVVKYFSEVAYDDNAQAYKGASIASRLIVNGDRRNTLINGTFDNIVSSLFTFTATDTFGRTTPEAYYELAPTNWVEYIKLSCSIKLSEMAADGDVEVTATGKYFDGSFGAQNNTITFTYSAAPTRGNALTGTATNVSFSIDENNNYTAIFTIPKLSYTDSYAISVTATDKLMSATSDSSVVAPEPIFDWGREDFNFNVPVNVNGEITAESIKINGYTVPSIVEQGTSGNWTYRKWSDGVAECWGIVTLNTAITTAWGSMYVGTTKMSKVNYPTSLFNAKPVETVTAQSPTNAIWVFAESGSTGVNSSTTTGIYNICRPNQVTTSSYYYLSFYVRGRWK